jgi:hypothetical protein
VSGFPAVLAYFALGLFWVHTLLIAAAGIAEAMGLLRAYGGTIRRIVVSSGAGPEGQFAVHRVRQVGRSRGDGKVWFHDRAYESELFGAAGEVWPGRAQQVEAAVCPNEQVREEARGRASKAAGWERTVEVEFTEGDPVWLFEGPGGQVVAGEDPRRWRTRVVALTGGLVIALLGPAGVVTGMCLAEPAFGTVSKIGALAGLVVFNLFQLLGKVHHEAIQPPSRRALLGRWG